VVSRRSFLGQTLATGLIAATNVFGGTVSSARRRSTYIDLLRRPDSVTAFTGLNEHFDLAYSGGEFAARDVVVKVDENAAESRVMITASLSTLTHVHLRWRCNVFPALLCLGDQWERS
jgi:hypothetical protein